MWMQIAFFILLLYLYCLEMYACKVWYEKQWEQSKFRGMFEVLIQVCCPHCAWINIKRNGRRPMAIRIIVVWPVWDSFKLNIVTEVQEIFAMHFPLGITKTIVVNYLFVWNLETIFESVSEIGMLHFVSESMK